MLKPLAMFAGDKKKGICVIDDGDEKANVFYLAVQMTNKIDG